VVDTTNKPTQDDAARNRSKPLLGSSMLDAQVRVKWRELGSWVFEI